MKLEFNGGWTRGEASHHIGKKMHLKITPSIKKYSRKNYKMEMK
jgi:hypothetical protein